MTENTGKLYVVGIGPGLPEQMTTQAQEIIKTADCIIAAPLYQQFLRQGNIISQTETERTPDVLDSSMDRQSELATEAFQRVREGQTVVHISGGDPNVYGKSDLLFIIAQQQNITDIPIEVIPGVTAGLSGAAKLGAPLSSDFCTISLGSNWRDWTEIETKIQAAAEGGFVIVLYNCWRNYSQAIDVLQAVHAPETPVAVFSDIGRKDAGRHPNGEDHHITTLGDIDEINSHINGMSTSILVGNENTVIWSNNHRKYLITPRGTEVPEKFQQSL
ncbi:cobalt-precorrin-2 C(20)-methyltransferase [Salinarchaeum sp. IM2453]|uniref:precorrin-3B C(17)-methyltransferase n=1 Tax=Salinarchaeum sp. IM2453 TaxID=2862870 RepID=UPI001C8392B7|nr:SAM-dependent methyltransferase [Salinarchaeum sp. IM2453]QZA88084.1 cobalt-precorrin-2 C(20)-methyltransferase [Salinarchaeum sp. IM2453]